MVKLIRTDLDFILQQIKFAEQHAAMGLGASPASLLPNSVVPFGLRTVTGQYNNLFSGQSQFGAADTLFPRALTQSFLNDADGDSIDFDGPGPGPAFVQGNYRSPGSVVDADPRTISNLIVDQGVIIGTGDTNNLAAYAVAYDPGVDGVLNFNGIAGDDVLKDGVQIIDGLRADGTPFQTFQFLNTTPDEGLSAPFNAWFTFFGQFFDHGLDLVTKGGNGKIYVPLQEDDPLYVVGGASNFMVVTRATQFRSPGADGVLGDDIGTVGVDESLDDLIETQNTTSPFVDQNQTYSSHPSHQVFLREYVRDGGLTVATGRLIEGAGGGMANWAEVKAQALTMLGIRLTDADIASSVPLLATDDYGKFIPSATGYAQVVVRLADNTEVLVSGTAAGLDLNNPLPLVTGETVVRTGHAFLNDIAHNANPIFSAPGVLAPDGDAVAGNPVANDGMGNNLEYDDELLNAHFIAGDGRVNENIGLTAVHAIFHSEHNRLVEHTKDVAIASMDASFVNQWLLAGVANQITQAQLDAINAILDPTDKAAAIDALSWNGERLFQAAKFGTEMQYQHLVFEEFARKVQPMVDVFLAPEGFDTTINPAIVAEFAHVVYRFGHSMLTETVDRFEADFSLVGADTAQIGLIQAFLNPLEFVASGNTPAQSVGNLVRGLTRTQGNEIDEFVTEALRNNLVGLPLDLPAINIARGRDTGVPTLNAARREFYAMTSDSQLKPYTSWADLSQNLKHAESLMNFIAAYGTHLSITSATTLAGKRAAAYALVYGEGGMDGDVLTLADNATVLFPSLVGNMPDEADRLAFLYSTGAYANLANGVTTTGVDAIDLWIGGLAEKQMPFGGLLGSTFNFVFETQMESLQNSDRFYYLSRLAGLNLLNEMENNSFAKLVMRNSDATHLPAEIFTTPGFTFEVNQAQQFTGLGPDGRADPIGDSALIPLVIRDNPDTPGPDTDYLRYTGDQHVVLGGTPGNDIMIASEGDDTIWGDAGNDRIEGGDGVDNVEGGLGDDIITDKGGDDILKGNEGNDVIHGGNGFNLILGGSGSDFIITGEDVSETFAGEGNDFILGAQMNLPTFGNEGDDWIEIGTSDGAGGDNFDPQEASTIIGHDVFITGGGFDEADGEGGDDIMVFSDGEDHFGGGGGFDWASYANDTLGVTADLLTNDLIEPPVAPSNQGILDRFADVEGLSGSDFSDVLRGDDATAADIDIAGALNGALTRAGLISGLQALLGDGVTRFASGNIILGGGGSDIIEGRGGDDIIDGDRALNVRISVRSGFDVNGPTATEIATFDSLSDPILLANMLNGTWNPGQLQIVREILTAAGPNFDTAMFSDVRANYSIVTVGGNTTVTHLVPDPAVPGTFIAGAVGIDGIDRLTNIERLQFAPNPAGLTPEDVTGRVILSGVNNNPAGALIITSGVDPGVLTASAAGITDADNPGLGGITGNPISFVWQAERDPLNAPGIFTDIVALGGGNPATAHGNQFTVTADLNGLLLRVRAIYQDANGTLETVFSASTLAVAAAITPAAAIPPETIVVSPGNGLHLIRADLQFMLDQILIAESRPDGNVLDVIANSRLPFGLRTVDGSFNNLVQGQTNFGASDQTFVLQIDQIFRDEQDGDTFDANGPAPGGLVTNTNYASTLSVADADPRIISNLISDQTAANLSAAIANGDAEAVLSPGLDGIFGNTDDRNVFFIPNATPDAALSAQFNTWFVFFGQFFDHGLDLVDKGGAGTVFIPLQADDPLIAGADGIFGNEDDLPVQQRFMAVTRATNSSVSPGPDGVLGTFDDVHLHNNETTPFVDQNQTYTSNPSHQVFLREYVLNGAGDPVSTGRLIDGLGGGIGNWAEVKAQAAAMLGIQLTDMNIFDVPLLATDAYGKFIPGLNGFAQFVTAAGLVEANPADNGGLGTLVPANGFFTGHAFLNDIAHNAVPGTVFDTDGSTLTPGTSVVAPDDDTVAGNTIATDFAGRKVAYDDELLDAHMITGDGRGNENIGLTSVHFIFHAEHNRMVGHLKDVAAASNDASFLNNWLVTAITQEQLDAINDLAPAARVAAIEALNWNGERIFQAARFSTEMQYQHLVFEEFARKIQPQVDVFLMEGQGYDSTINPAIVAEFAHVVYRFGHSMLTETIDRFDPNFNVIGNPNGLDPAGQQIGLIAAFLNPLAFTQTIGGVATLTAAEGAGAVIRGLTRQPGNEIDEFVTEALRNNLVGLPLDLPAINLARGRDTGVPTLNQARAEFYAMTGDSQLKPYTSWVDLAMNLKHVESVINFIAAYGTHVSITSATTTIAKRSAAYALVYGEGGIDGIVADDPLTLLVDESADNPTVPVPGDRVAFLFGPAATTGVNAIDLWIGGLAEKQMPFGGLLGSTFNFVFETQMEKLQNGDRFYYLERTAGLNFLTELENNSFAKLIMANTNVKHLPGDVFSTPTWNLEVDQALQFNSAVIPGPDGILRDDLLTVADESADNLPGNTDPTEGGSVLTPLVIRDNPNTLGPDTNYLQYTGVDHVVLGGTAGNDILIASIGDDTLYGDGGDDRLDGGYGVDMTLGGAGDDIITDVGGDDNLQGQDGNDAIHGGNGINLILGGFGNDFIITGEDESEAFGGGGNDFIRGIKPVEMLFGNEGDDWIEDGMADGSAGENFDTRGLDSIIGNDVFMGDSVADRMLGEGGDDIMLGNGGTGDRYIGASGFDWASFDHPTLSGIVDLNLRAFDETPVPLGPSSVLARFESVEGVSGSAFGDILRGDDFGAAGIAASGFTGSVLTNIDLIDGLQNLLDDLLGGPVTSFGAGNIMLGGAGSDIIEGRGGDDLIDGDAWLNVRISVKATADADNNQIADRDANGELVLGAEIGTTDSMTGILLNKSGTLLGTPAGLTLADAVFAGAINPGQLVIAREILVSPTENFDTAVFSNTLFDANNANAPNYEIRVNGALQDLGDGVTPPSVTIIDGDIVTVTDISVRTLDGTDTLRNIERLQFADRALVINGGNNAPEGLALISGTFAEDQVLTASIGTLKDADNPGSAITGTVAYFWQFEKRLDSGVFEDIIVATGLGDVHVTGLTFTPGDAEVGLRLRLRVVYQDANGVIEQGFSAPTDPIANVNDAPVGLPALSDATPTQDIPVTALLGGITDADGLTNPNFTFQWQRSNDGTIFADIGGATAPSYSPVAADVNQFLRVVVQYTDDGGTLETVTSPASLTRTGQHFIGNAAGNTFNGTAFDDWMQGFGGNDNLNGNGGSDLLDGGLGNDTLNGGDGDDFLNGEVGADLLNGGAGNDTMNGGANNDTYIVEDAGDVVVEAVGGGTDVVQTTLAAYTLTAEVENLTFTGAGNFAGTGNGLANTIAGAGGDDTLSGLGGADTLQGNGGADTLIGGAGGDNLQGGAGNDVLRGGADNDTLNGAAGSDTASYVDETDAMFINLQAGNTRRGSAAAAIEDTLIAVENAAGGAGADNFTGSTGANVISGNGGDDTINYAIGGGADTVDGGLGTDTLAIIGGAGADTLDLLFNGASITSVEGGAVSNLEAITANLAGGNDTLSYAGSTAAVNVNLATNTASGLASILNIENATGGNGDDTLTSGAGAQTLNGGGGADTLDGGAGNDTLTGGAGNDTFIANNGDTINEAIGGGTDIVFTDSATFTLAGQVENLTFTGAGAFTGNGNGQDNVITGGNGGNTLNGNGGADTLIGGAGVDGLNGGGGNDRLTGGIGNDVMDGGGGVDTFVLTPGFGVDIIGDFDANPNPTQDFIDVSALGITAATFAASVTITDLGANTLLTFAGGDTVTLMGVNGVGANVITAADFIFAP